MDNQSMITVATYIAIIVGLLSIGNFAITIWNWFRKKYIQEATSGPPKTANGAPVTPSDYVWGTVLALACAAVWGISYASLKFITVTIDPIEMNVALLGVATTTYFVATLVVGRISAILSPKPVESHQQRKRLVIDWASGPLWRMLLGNFASFILFIYALYYISATQTIALQKVNPIFVALLASLFLRRRIGLQVWLAIVLVVVGTMLIVANFSDGSFSLRTGDDFIGSIYAILAGLSFAVFTVALAENVATEKSLVLQLQLMTVVFLFAFVAFVSYAYFFGHAFELGSAESNAILIVNGIRIALVYILFFAAVQRIGPVLASAIVALEVFITMLVEYWWLDAVPESTLWLGAIIIVTGSATVLLRQAQHNVNPE